jgi:hypothetical protein
MADFAITRPSPSLMGAESSWAPKPLVAHRHIRAGDRSHLSRHAISRIHATHVQLGRAGCFEQQCKLL